MAGLQHSFSFSRHYSPDNTHHGQLLVLNDDRVAGGTVFETHPHRDMEIVTWVLDGELEHQDSEGNRGLIYPGLAQRMSAGRGIFHSEKNWSATDDVHFIQMWVIPDTEAIDPGYQQLDINDQLAKGGLVPVASGRARRRHLDPAGGRRALGRPDGRRGTGRRTQCPLRSRVHRSGRRRTGGQRLPGRR
ncbi:MAG: pirin family protein [Ilumatobacteraceae bacterium]